MMLGEFMNSIYEVHSFCIGFVVSVILSFLFYLVYILKEKDKRQEIAVFILIAITLLYLLFNIPDWVMKNNFYQEIHYGLFGIFIGVLLGIGVPWLIRKIYK